MSLLEQIVQLDKYITLWINGLPSVWSDPFWWAFSDKAFWYPLYFAILVFLIWKLGWKRGLLVALTVVLTVVCLDQFSNVIKNGVARFRPCFDPWMNANGLRLPYGVSGGKYGFFSAHAGNSFGFAMASYLGLKWFAKDNTARYYGWGIFLWATLVSVSRLVMGAHYMGDITVGAIVGAAFGAAWAWIAQKIASKI
ncbi:MAG: phosphatase PAP2 family protein [Bacteroidales bacterium]|nr:phosphatase PAP2 family protein [Bacteroidales bacterium]